MITTALEFRGLVIVTFTAVIRLNCDQPIVSGGGNRSTWHKALPNNKSITHLSLMPRRRSDPVSGLSTAAAAAAATTTSTTIIISSSTFFILS